MTPSGSLGPDVTANVQPSYPSPMPEPSTVFEDGTIFSFPLLGLAAAAYDQICKASLSEAFWNLYIGNYFLLTLTPATQPQAAQLLAAAQATGKPIDRETILWAWGFSAVMNQRWEDGDQWAPSVGMALPAIEPITGPMPVGGIPTTALPPFPPAAPATPAAPVNSNVVQLGAWLSGMPGAVGSEYATLSGPTPVVAVVGQTQTNIGVIAGTPVKLVPIGTGYNLEGQIVQVYQITGFPPA